MLVTKTASSGQVYYYRIHATTGKLVRISREAYVYDLAKTKTKEKDKEEGKEKVLIKDKHPGDMSVKEKDMFRAFLYSNCFGGDFSSAANIRLPGRIYWVEDAKEGKVLSTLSITAEGMIWNVCTRHDQRGRGLAQRLFQRLFRDFPRRTLQLQVWSENAPAISLYNKLGFRKLFTAMTETGRQYDVMQKT